MSNNRMLVGFTGPAGSGKDTCGMYLFNRYGYSNTSFALPLKMALQTLGFGWPTTHAEKEAIIPWIGKSYRHLAQTLGTEWARECVNQDFWVLLMEEHLNFYSHPKFSIAITDVRFENEAALIRKLGGVVVHLTGRKIPTGNDAHASEQSIASNPDDWTIYNDAELPYLHQQLDDLHSYMKSRL